MPGFLAYLLVDVERRTGMVELANTTNGPVFSGHELLEILQAHEPSIATTWHPVPEIDADMLDAVGIWHWGPTPFVLRAHGTDQLELGPVGPTGRGSRFVQVDGRWVGTANYWRGERLQVVRREDGSVSHLDLGSFVFTRRPYDPDAPIPGGVSADPWRSPPA